MLGMRGLVDGSSGVFVTRVGAPVAEEIEVDPVCVVVEGKSSEGGHFLEVVGLHGEEHSQRDGVRGFFPQGVDEVYVLP